MGPVCLPEQLPGMATASSPDRNPHLLQCGRTATALAMSPEGLAPQGAVRMPLGKMAEAHGLRPWLQLTSAREDYTPEPDGLGFAF